MAFVADDAGLHELIGGVSGNDIRPQAAPHGGGLRIQIGGHLIGHPDMVGEKLLVGHGVQPLMPAVVVSHRHALVGFHLQVFAFQFVGDGRLAEAAVPGIHHHAVVVVIKSRVRLLPGDVHGAIDIPRDDEILVQPFGGLVFEVLGQAQLVPEVVVPAYGFGAVRREHATVRALRRPQPVAIHLKLILLGLAAEHGMVVQHQHGSLGALLMISVRRAQTGKTAAHDHQVIDLAGIDGFLERLFERAVAHAVAVVDHFVGVAVGGAVIAHAPRPGPFRPQPGQRNAQGLRVGFARQARGVGEQQTGAGA